MKRLYSRLVRSPKKTNDAIKVEAIEVEVDASGCGTQQQQRRQDDEGRTAFTIDSSSLNDGIEVHLPSHYGEEGERPVSLASPTKAYLAHGMSQQVAHEMPGKSGLLKHGSRAQIPSPFQYRQPNMDGEGLSTDAVADLPRKSQEIASKPPPGTLDSILRSSYDISANTDQLVVAFDDRDKYGLFVLRDKPSNQTGIVDVVAIHGLNGHYSRTWTSKNGSESRNWLKEFLPEQILNTRIMSFGYNSAIQFSKSEADISTFAEQLLEELLALRCTQIEKHRPLVFLCHSLGGIVFKKVST